MIGSEPQVPTWAIVSDMNIFRLYWYDRGHQQYVEFVIEPRNLFDGPGLLTNTDAARFDRFLFSKLFHRDTLLTKGGRSTLLNLIQERRFRDRKIEEAFYAEYRALRDRLYTELLARNGEGTPRFPGTRGRLVRLAQKTLDRLLFVFFCDDMGQRLAYPAKLLQTLLTDRANSAFFDPQATTIWQDLLGLFRAMNTGTEFGGRPMHQFNGGLFAPDPALESLEVPNSVFCQHLQGQNEASIASHPQTVLYLCATYNYAADLGEGGQRNAQRSLGLYTLGRIFEQSITELEILEADADDRPSVNKASQRKRDGVYYTPEWIVERVVDGTLAPALTALRHSCGWDEDSPDLPTLAGVDAYLDRLRLFTVVDPACGSGAFLITALRYLASEWRRTWDIRKEVAGVGDKEIMRESEAELVARLLRENIYGVDINLASVEIAQLALWLHTARDDQPLSSLEATIRCGNSLITHDFYKGVQLNLYDANEQERVNAFDWFTAFPNVFARGGFDAVVGNPPYVKLQNFRQAHPDVSDYLVRGRPGIVERPYSSTTGNFDLYLPFIEKGISLLNSAGRLGYIAPSLWTINEYGAGLRAQISAKRQLDRWLDFKSYQVFDEATTYTALQFYTKSPTKVICVAHAPNGVVSPDPWADVAQQLEWGKEQFGDRWLLLTGVERALVDRLAATCSRLDDDANTTHIFQGLITSSDAIYHLTRSGPGRYICRPPGSPRPPPYELEIEDAIMRPLVSGAEAKRYQNPQTNTWLLFPYAHQNGQVRLVPASAMAASYPGAWKHLLSYEDILRSREAGQDARGNLERPFDDDAWYRFGRSQALDKQHLPKLIVAQTVPSLRICFDATGAFAPNNVRVNGILPSEGMDPWFLMGILNAPVANWVFQRIAKPKDAGWFEANRQFIAPLPVPHSTALQRCTVGSGAQELQRLHTENRDAMTLIARRLKAVANRARPETWLFSGLRAPARGAEDHARYENDLIVHHDALTASLKLGVSLDAALANGELRFLVNDTTVLDRVFVSEAEGQFVLAQWKVVAATFPLTERASGKRLSRALRTLASLDNMAVVEQVVAASERLKMIVLKIQAKELEINSALFALYGLNTKERELIARG